MRDVLKPDTSQKVLCFLSKSVFVQDTLLKTSRCNGAEVFNNVLFILKGQHIITQGNALGTGQESSSSPPSSRSAEGSGRKEGSRGVFLGSQGGTSLPLG